MLHRDPAVTIPDEMVFRLSFSFRPSRDKSRETGYYFPVGCSRAMRRSWILRCVSCAAAGPETSEETHMQEATEKFT